MVSNCTLAVLLTVGALIFGSGAEARVRYAGSHHTVSHGGRYAGGSGSSHRGGRYVNARTGNHYGRHR